MQVAQRFEHFRADRGKLVGGSAGQRLGPIELPEPVPIHFGAQDEHGVVAVKGLPYLIKGCRGEGRRQTRRRFGLMARSIRSLAERSTGGQSQPETD